jgi:hypothetical protein
MACFPPRNPTDAASRGAAGARSISASTIRCIVTSFTPMSNVRFSSRTCTSDTRPSNAPSVAVRGTSRSTPASASTQPVMIWYAGAEPMVVHSSALSVISPTGVTSAVSGGAGNCVGMTLVMPYSSSDAASTRRTARRHQASHPVSLRRRVSKVQAIAMATAAASTQNH